MNTSSSSKNLSGAATGSTITQRCRQVFEALGFYCQITNCGSVFESDKFLQLIEGASRANNVAATLRFLPDLFVLHPKLDYERGVFFGRVFQGVNRLDVEELSIYEKYYPERILVIAPTDTVPSILHAQWLSHVVTARGKTIEVQPSSLPLLREILTHDVGIDLSGDFSKRIQRLNLEI